MERRMRRHWKAGAAGFIGPIGQLQPDTSTRLPVHGLVRHLGLLYLPKKTHDLFSICSDTRCIRSKPDWKEDHCRPAGSWSPGEPEGSAAAKEDAILG